MPTPHRDVTMRAVIDELCRDGMRKIGDLGQLLVSADGFAAGLYSFLTSKWAVVMCKRALTGNT